MSKALQAKAKEIIEKGIVEVVIGYAEKHSRAAPCFVFEPGDSGALVFNESCGHNLTRFLRDFPGRKVGIVAKACDARAIQVLIQERQVAREGIYVLGVECFGQRTADGAWSRKCPSCPNPKPVLFDFLAEAGEPKEKPPRRSKPDDDAERLTAMSIEELRRFWQDCAALCIRCYACRAVCPLCYCRECLFDKTRPPWVDRTPVTRSNFSFHLIRAFHLAGRCVGCEECERACPMRIPLGLLNRKMAQVVWDHFDYEPGVSSEGAPPLVRFSLKDGNDFIR